MRLEVWCFCCWWWWCWWCCCEGVTPVAAVRGGTKVYPTKFFPFREEIHAGAGYQSFSRDFVESSNRTGLYLRENLCRELHDLQERHLYPETEEPACERLLFLSFIRRPHSTDVLERTILESSELDSLYRSIILNTTSTILAKKEASVLRKPPTPSPRRIHHLPQRHTHLASPYRC